jgi:hypothetical protein
VLARPRGRKERNSGNARQVAQRRRCRSGWLLTRRSPDPGDRKNACAGSYFVSVLSPKIACLSPEVFGCFSRRERQAYLNRYVRESNGKKQPTGRARKVAMKMSRRLRLLVGHVSIQICSAPPVRLGSPCRRPNLIATKGMLFRGTAHSVGFQDDLISGCFNRFNAVTAEGNLRQNFL